jgi:hydroxymethylbilane synthase
VGSKSQYRLCGDDDLLSRIQLDEIAALLRKHNPKAAIDIIHPEESASATEPKTTPNSPTRVALLMNLLLEDYCDALVLNASSLPVKMHEGLCIAALSNRLTPYDVLISDNECILDELPLNAKIAANEIRREAQMLYYRPDLKLVRTKGGVDALIQKVKSAKMDAVILAAADVERLSKQDCVVEFLTSSVCIPAAGQGSLAVLTRSGNEQAKKLIAVADDPASRKEIVAEWSFLEHLGLSELDPVGVLGSIEGDRLELEGVVALPDGREKICSVVRGSPGKEVELGQLLAKDILEAGGAEILQELNLV